MVLVFGLPVLPSGVHGYSSLCPAGRTHVHEILSVSDLQQTLSDRFRRHTHEVAGHSRAQQPRKHEQPYGAAGAQHGVQGAPSSQKRAWSMLPTAKRTARTPFSQTNSSKCAPWAISPIAHEKSLASLSMRPPPCGRAMGMWGFRAHGPS